MQERRRPKQKTTKLRRNDGKKRSKAEKDRIDTSQEVARVGGGKKQRRVMERALAEAWCAHRRTRGNEKVTFCSFLLFLGKWEFAGEEKAIVSGRVDETWS